MPVHESMIHDVLAVERVVRPRQGLRFSIDAPTGHLIHLVMSGRMRQTCDGRAYDLSRGDAIWYHQDMAISAEILFGPCDVACLYVSAPDVPPPDEEQRYYPGVGMLIEPIFLRLIEAWNSDPGLARTLCVQGSAGVILGELLARSGHAGASDPDSRLWWLMEE